MHPEEKALSGRHWGYTDPMGVRPEFQRQGLGSAVLLGGLHYLQRRDVEAASFMTSSQNTAMLELGTSVGFRKISRYLWLAKKV